ncbi:hypothetical protein BGZ88_011415 [Linnemannia elongata]|nr:hypothetical protein BGZ88_011415 [Linnemannia elongata]
MPNLASFTDLPQEIIDIIIPQISSKDYSSCVGVSPAWSAIFTPTFWKVVRLVNKTMHESFGSKEARNALARNCGHIRTVETTDPAFVSFLSVYHPCITKLESLTLRLKEHPVSRVTELMLSSDHIVPTALVGQEFMDVPRCASKVITVLQNNPNLRYLSLDLGCFRYKDGLDGFADLVSAFPTTHLEKLELSFLNSIPYDKDIHDGSNKDLDIWNLSCFNQFFQEPFRALKEIVITGGSQNNMDHNRLVFLTRCPNVETLRLHRLDVKALEVLPLCLRVACHKLSRLEWRKSLYDNDEDIHALIHTTKSGWRELRLPDMPLFGAFAFSALMKNILVHAQETYLDHVMGGTDRSWVLGPSMEHFQLRLEGVPRPDVLYRQSGGDFVTDHALDPTLRLDVQRWIYTQLSRMTGLRELILGLQDLSAATMRSHEIDFSMDAVEMEEAVRQDGIRMFNYQSLEFSLESGLDLLAGLKEMRILDIRSTAHYIGVSELEWMHRKLPNLN